MLTTHFQIVLITSLCLGFAICQTVSNDATFKGSTVDQTIRSNETVAPETTSTRSTSYSTTVTTKPVPSFQLPDDTYGVNDDGKVCILLKLDAKFSFDYKEKIPKAEDTTDIALPDDVENSGDCGSDSKIPEIVLSWLSYKLKFTFAKTTSDKTWFVQSLEFSRTVGDKDRGNSFTSASKESELDIKAPLNMSYECSIPDKVKLYDDKGSLIAYAVLENIKVQAFAASDGSFGIEYPCPEKKPKETEIFYQSDTVPIAVGSTLAVVTILIVAAYGIYRSLFVKKVDYDTMED